MTLASGYRVQRYAETGGHRVELPWRLTKRILFKESYHDYL